MILSRICLITYFRKSAAEREVRQSGKLSAVLLFTEKTWVIAALNISNMDTQEDRRKGMILPDYAFQAAYGCDKMKKAVQQQSEGIHMKRRWFCYAV